MSHLLVIDQEMNPEWVQCYFIHITGTGQRPVISKQCSDSNTSLAGENLQLGRYRQWSSHRRLRNHNTHLRVFSSVPGVKALKITITTRKRTQVGREGLDALGDEKGKRQRQRGRVGGGARKKTSILRSDQLIAVALVVKQKLEETVTWLELEPGTRWLAQRGHFFRSFSSGQP